MSCAVFKSTLHHQRITFCAIKKTCNRSLSLTPQYFGIFSKLTPEFVKKKNRPNIAVLNLFGTILSGNPGIGRQTRLNYESIDKSIDKAFSTKRLQAVLLNVNSPGGSPTQSELIANRIIKLGNSKNVEVISFVEDTALSGGYWLALAGSKIFVTKNSVIGSIGAISQSFGFQNILKRYDIERRVQTAGENKLKFDPFSPEKENDVVLLRQILSNVHQNFIEHVKDRRGDRLKRDDDYLFNGDFWTGKDAVECGLVDGINDLYSYVEENYGKDVNIVRINRPVKKGLAALLGSKAFSIEDIEDYVISNRIKLM